MKRVWICVLLAALLCCGCNANEKPEPIHLEESGNGALSLLFPDEGQANKPAATPVGSNSEVLGNLLSQGSNLPEVEGYETATLREQCDALTGQVEAALADEKIDRAALRQQISQLSGVVSLTAAKAAGDKSLTPGDQEALAGFFAGLTAELSALQAKLA